MQGISGFTCARNVIENDYCLLQCVESMLGVADEVVICDSDSTDGTTEMINKWAVNDKRIRVVNRPWLDPVGRISWLIEWMQAVQQSLRYDQQLYLDADEVLDPSCYPVLKAAPADRCFWFHRINYWKDVRHVIPHGHTCSHLVARFGPTTLPMHSDEIHDGVQFPLPEPEMRTRAISDPALVIHHLGFLRKREAMFSKCKAVLRAFFNRYDSRLVEAAKHPDRPWQDFCYPDRPLLNHAGPFPPDFCNHWLKTRGVA